MIKLYSYFRSSASFRVRIALNLKQLTYEIVPIHLVKNNGEQHAAEYLALNPSGLIPSIDHDGKILIQSGAICEYLNEVYPDPPLLPHDVVERAWVRGVCNLIACDIHPINNLRVLNYLTKTLGHDESQKKDWYQHWIKQGFDALEKVLTPHAGHHCLGNMVTMADVFVVPQVWNAQRYQCRMDDYPILQQVYENAMQLSAFQKASPAAQPDAE